MPLMMLRRFSCPREPVQTNSVETVFTGTIFSATVFTWTVFMWTTFTGTAFMWPTNATADWLITAQGSLIETEGPWTISGTVVTYTDLEGLEKTLELAEIDLEGSDETTALRAGRAYEPRAQETPDKTVDEATAKILVYVTGLCRSCTEAKQLLDDLGVVYRVRNIDSDRQARKEYEKKAGHGGGVPVIDVDGTMIFTFNPRVIREKIGRFLKKQAEAEAEAAAQAAQDKTG